MRSFTPCVKFYRFECDLIRIVALLPVLLLLLLIIVILNVRHLENEEYRLSTFFECSLQLFDKSPVLRPSDVR